MPTRILPSDIKTFMLLFSQDFRRDTPDLSVTVSVASKFDILIFSFHIWKRIMNVL